MPTSKPIRSKIFVLVRKRSKWLSITKLKDLFAASYQNSASERTTQGIKIRYLRSKHQLARKIITKKACPRSSWETSIPIFLMIFFVLLLLAKHFKTPSNVELFTWLFDLLVRTEACNIKYVKVVLMSQNFSL